MKKIIFIFFFVVNTNFLISQAQIKFLKDISIQDQKKQIKKTVKQLLKNGPISNSGLLAYYSFDGDVNDTGGANYDGVLNGGTFTDDSSGNPNSVLKLDGVDDYVDLSSFATTYRDNISKLSVYFKVKFDKTTNNQTILSLGSSGESLSTNVFEIEYENNRLQIETEVGSGSNREQRIDGRATLFDNNWHEILITFEGANLKYYRDGDFLFDGTYVPAETTAADLFLGTYFAGGGSHAGIQIDDLQFYGRILDGNQSNLTITEISYNSNDDNGSDDEWIELYNPAGNSVDISGWTLDNTSANFNGTFTFPANSTIAAGEYITIALGSNGDGVFNNDNPFTPDYNNLGVSNEDVGITNDTNHIINIASTFNLKNSSGSFIDRVAYDDDDAGGSQGSSHDGGGLTFELINNTESINADTGSNWQASAFKGGSPGKVNTTTWLGAIDNDWDTSDNWSAGIPISNSDVLVPNSLINYPTAASAVNLNSVTMYSGASLIAESTFSGTVSYHRNIPTTNWYLVAAPVNGQTIVDFYSNESPALGSGTGDDQNVAIANYDNSQANPNDRWNYYKEGQVDGENGNDTSDIFTPGIGYTILLQSKGDIAFTGTMNVSNFTNLSLTDNSLADGNAFNLMGNPYTSYIAVNDNANATDNILSENTSLLTEETIWIWDQSANSGSGAYAIYNQTSSGFHIAPSQGFFVSANGNSSTFSIKEEMQSHQTSDSFQKTESTRPEIHISLTNGTEQKVTSIFYLENSTTGFDNGYDSSIFGGVESNFEIYSHAVSNGIGRNLGIQTLPSDNLENMIIPIGIEADSNQNITISATSLNFSNGLNVYLEDKEDKEDDSFTLLDVTSKYTTTLTSALNGVGRFYIHISSQVLSNDNINIEHISIYTSSKNNLRIEGIQNENVVLSIYNIAGKQVLKDSFKGVGVNDVMLPNLKIGVYLVKLATETRTFNKKVIIK